MYKLPKDQFLEDLVGQEINLVSIGPYDAQIAFDGGVVIQSLYKLEGEINGKKSLWFDREWLNTEQLLHLPKKEVVGVINQSAMVLKIVLTGGVALYVHTEVSQYESINITHSNGILEIV
ncbi:hypothetical protein [Desulfatitalea tepidiphila]|uniref:hypothetical protein n=1 Tax=Desulfatitalea tepidiphila TaxID=1185843 RepID=UPI0006B42A08|nr:hypothetical protein [Desulfatitalea tepidiphila]